MFDFQLTSCMKNIEVIPSQNNLLNPLKFEWISAYDNTYYFINYTIVSHIDIKRIYLLLRRKLYTYNLIDLIYFYYS